MKKFFDEFKAFALRGNVVDLAIGVLIGGAFSTLVGALTEDIINPILNLLGGANAELGWAIKLGEGEGQALLIGAFVSAIINFIIMAFVIFMIMKTLNKLASIGEKKAEEAPAKEEKASDSKEKWQEITLGETEKTLFDKAKAEGQHFYGITVYVQESCILKAARAFLVFKALEEQSRGEINSVQ